MEKYIRIFSLPVPVLLSICLSRLIWPFTLVEKFVCNITFTLKVNFVFSIITILVKLSELIWGVTILVLWFVSNDRSSHRTCSVRKTFLRNFTKLTGKHLCQSLFLIKLQAIGLIRCVSYHNGVISTIPYISGTWGSAPTRRELVNRQRGLKGWKN